MSDGWENAPVVGYDWDEAVANLRADHDYPDEEQDNEPTDKR